MSLKGNLRDISLEHIFEIINSGDKTGSLHIIRGEGDIEAFIYFRNGKIFGAVSNYNRIPIGERLVKVGYISEEDLVRALGIQKQDKKSRKLGQVMLQEKLITEDMLKQIVREQIQATVFDVLSWIDGDFQFSTKLPPVEDIGLLVNAKNVVLEGTQRIDEWKRLRKKVPSPNSVFAINDEAPRGKNITLSPRHWQLLGYIDGERSVDDLLILEQLSEFQTCSILAELVSAGLIKVSHEKHSSKETENEQVQKKSKGSAKGVRAVDETDDKPSVAAKDESDLEDKSSTDEEVGSEFQSIININNLDEMSPNDVLAYRSVFMKELNSLTENKSEKPIRSISSLSSIKKNKRIDTKALKEALKKFK